MTPPVRLSPNLFNARDALVWALLSLLVLAVLPIGYVSADGLGQALLFAAGPRPLNPNHLLYEPLASRWLRLLAPGEPPDRAVDWLKRLSILAGAVAVGLFRAGVAPRLAGSRAAANHATTWLALSSAFSRLWISDEVQMVQMPAVVLVAALAVRALDAAGSSHGLRGSESLGSARGTGLAWSLAAGAATGVAAAFFASNLLLAPALAVVGAAALLREGHRRRALSTALGIALGSGLSAGLIFSSGWRLSGSAQGLLAWATRYTGGDLPARVALAYGLVPSPGGVASAALRALYGAACSLVDLAPAVEAWREAGAVRASLLAVGMALAIGAIFFGFWGRRSPPVPQEAGDEIHPVPEDETRRQDRDALVLAAAWLLAILAFGFLWDNSDDQFYFQLAVAWGALAARLPLGPLKTPRLLVRRAPVALVLSVLALAWNTGDLGVRRVFYPRAERVELLRRELGAAGLIVNGGFDDLDVLLTLTGLEKAPSAGAPGTVRRIERIRLAPLAVDLPPQQGLARLASAIAATLAAGRPVALLDLYDTPAAKNPWKFLHRLGYERRDVLAIAARFPVAATSRRIGPFTLRWIHPPHGPGPRYHRPPGADA